MIRSTWSNFARNANARAKRLGLLGRLAPTPDQPFGPCHYCGDVSATGWDHVVSMARGGENSLANLVPCCQSCNRAKHIHPVSEMGLYPIRVLCGWCWSPLLRDRHAIRSAARLNKQAFVCGSRCAGKLVNHPMSRRLLGLGPAEGNSSKAHTLYMREWRRRQGMAL